MRSPFALLSFALAFAVDAGAQPASAAAPEVLSSGDASGIRAAHEAWKRRAVETHDGLAVRDAGQQWRATFDGRGFTIAPDEGAWTWGLALERWGFQGELREVEGLAAGCADGERVEYAHDASLTEWYVNGARGLEHGFTVHCRPEGDGALAFELAVCGGLATKLDADGRGARFVDAAGALVLSYTGLAVFDADGRALDATLNAHDGGIAIEIDERGARYPLTIDPIVQQAYLKASNTSGQDNFGRAVSISGDTAVVAAKDEDSNSTGVNGNQANDSAINSGAAYVFVRNAGVWSQQAYLKASNTGADDQFGWSVAVSGDTVVVGAIWEDSNATGVNGDGTNNSATDSGAAYVYVRSGTAWSHQAYLKASNTDANDWFGVSVTVSGDTIIVGSERERSNATGIGGNQADNSVPGAGAAYVFVRNAGVWTQQAYVKASNSGTNDLFGHSLSLSGDTLLVGAFQEASNATVIGGNQADNSLPAGGAAYVFTRSGTVWSQQAYIKPSNMGSIDRFAVSVSLSGDTAVCGAEWEDSAATGVGGNQASNAAAESGAAYVFVRNGTVWSQQAYLKASNTGAGDEFGGSVAISGDTIVIGSIIEDSNATGINGNQADNSAVSSGAAYVFSRSGTVWAQQAYLKSSNSEAFDFFGAAVAVSSLTVLVGAWGEDSSATGVGGNQANNDQSGAGAAYVFTISPPAPVPYCFGDGTDAFCPCSPAPVPHGAPGKGCPTNIFPGGSLATASGLASISADTLVLTAVDMINGAMIFYQGPLQQSGGGGVAFGDGKRCIQSASIRRFKTKTVVGNTVSYPVGADVKISIAGNVLAAGTRNYQGWYRSANPTFCTVDTFNLTNGLLITWVP